MIPLLIVTTLLLLSLILLQIRRTSKLQTQLKFLDTQATKALKDIQNQITAVHNDQGVFVTKLELVQFVNKKFAQHDDSFRETRVPTGEEDTYVDSRGTIDYADGKIPR